MRPIGLFRKPCGFQADICLEHPGAAVPARGPREAMMSRRNVATICLTAVLLSGWLAAASADDVRVKTSTALYKPAQAGAASVEPVRWRSSYYGSYGPYAWNPGYYAGYYGYSYPYYTTGYYTGYGYPYYSSYNYPYTTSYSPYYTGYGSYSTGYTPYYTGYSGYSTPYSTGYYGTGYYGYGGCNSCY
jgi:hypothetical protein